MNNPRTSPLVLAAVLAAVSASTSAAPASPAEPFASWAWDEEGAACLGALPEDSMDWDGGVRCVGDRLGGLLVEKATSDWDVAEGICDKVASGTELTAREKAQIADDQETQMMIAGMMADMGSQMANMANQLDGDPSLGHTGQALGAVMGLMSAFEGATAEEDKKAEAYLECMKGLGWEMK